MEQNDLTPYQLFQLERYGDILPVVVYQGVSVEGAWEERELVKEQIENETI